VIRLARPTREDFQRHPARGLRQIGAARLRGDAIG
jgi:hypothetical protein